MEEPDQEKNNEEGKSTTDQTAKGFTDEQQIHIQPPPAQKRKWVRFEESVANGTENATENLENGEPEAAAKPIALPRNATLSNGNHKKTSNDVSSDDVAQIDVQVEEARHPGRPSSNPRTMEELTTAGSSSADREIFANGKVLSQIMPENQHCAWLAIAHFNPYKIPKTLISDKLTMPVEDYIIAMKMLTNDFRFRSYIVLYRRLIAGWLVLSLFILIILLLSGLRGLILFGLTLLWLFLTCAGVLVCLFIKKRINKGLHNCVSSTNRLLLRYHLLVGVEDRGKLSCHKIVIPYVYFNAAECRSRIVQLLSHYRQHDDAVPAQRQSQEVATVSVDVDPPGVFTYRKQTTPEDKADSLILKYSQSYVKATVRRTIRFPSRPLEGVSEESPLHCRQSLCLCQYLKKYHFERAPKRWYHYFF